MKLNTGRSHRAGEIMSSASVLIGNSIKKLTLILKKAGSPTGQITVTDPAASFDGIKTKQTHKVATSSGYASYNNADIAGHWSKLG
jgi:hypothetical protein